MTREEIEQKTSLCFLLNPNIPEEEKKYVIERVMATKATIVPKAAICNIITYIMKQNAELKDKLEILISVGNTCTKGLSKQLTKAKEIIKDYMIIVKGGNITACSVPEENRCINVLKLNEQAEQFIREAMNGDGE